MGRSSAPFTATRATGNARIRSGSTGRVRTSRNGNRRVATRVTHKANGNTVRRRAVRVKGRNGVVRKKVVRTVTNRAGRVVGRYSRTKRGGKITSTNRFHNRRRPTRQVGGNRPATGGRIGGNRPAGGRRGGISRGRNVVRTSPGPTSQVFHPTPRGRTSALFTASKAKSGRKRSRRRRR